MPDETIQKNTKSLVPTAYYEMLYLRFMGLTYEQIADKTNYSHSRVRALFARGGVLHDLYRQWVDTAKKNSMEEALDMMFGHLPDIIRSRIVLAKSLGMGSNEAAKIILNYTLGNPDRPLTQTNIQINNENKITGFNYIVPDDPNNKTGVETAPSVPSTERPSV